MSTAANLAFHYDEVLQNSSSVVGIGRKISTRYDLWGTSESFTLASVTGGFLQ